MEQTIKMEVKIEKAEPRDENDPTPLRERLEESPRASGFEPDTSVSKCGWDSDPEEDVQHSARPPTPGASLQATIQPKDDFKMDPEHVMLDDLLNDLPNTPPPSSSASCPTTVPPFNPALDGLPSAYTARENLEDMDLCSLGDEDSDAELIAEKMEILRKLAMVNESDQGGSGEQKKKKKSGKRKRSHHSSKEKEEEAESKKRPRSNSSPDESQKENKRNQSHHWPGRRIKAEKPDLDYVPVRDDEKRLRVVKTSNLLESTPKPPKIVPKMENLSKQDKRNLGVARAQLALELFQKNANKDDEREVLMVETMCKLPVHESFRNQNGFENPSPLCNNMNVVYEFNSAPGTRIELSKWGLEVLPRPIRELCRILGIDIHRLKEIQKTATPSQHILRLKKEQMELGVGSEEAEANKATLLKDAGTQTDNKTFTQDAGIQARLEAPPLDSTFWQKRSFNPTDLSQQQSNVMYALQEIARSIPDAAIAETLYRRLCLALDIVRQTIR